MNFPPNPAQAQCALHPSAPATLTCSRCGNFMCADCADQGLAALCPTCRKLTGAAAFPFTRDDFDFGRLWEHVFEVWKRDWVMLSVVTLVGMILPSVLVMPLSFVAGLLQAIVGAAAKEPAAMMGVAAVTQLFVMAVAIVGQAFVQLGMARVMLDVLTGRPVDLARLFSQTGKLWRGVGATFIFVFLSLLALAAPMFSLVGAVLAGAGKDPSVAFGALGAGGLLLLFIGYGFVIVLSLVWLVAIDELAFSDCGAVEAFRRAWTLLDGMKWRALGYAFVGGLVMFVGVLACCVGMFPAFALTQLLLTGFFLCLRFGSTLPAPPSA